jgi:hypothetical protein
MTKLHSVARLAVSLILLAATPLVVRAQTNNFKFNISAGASFPTGNFGDNHDVGYNLGVGIGVRQPTSPLGFRLEGQYNEWSVSNFNDFKRHAGGVLGNLVYDFPIGQPATRTRGTAAVNTLYAVGGLGAFGVGNGDTNMGWNIGGGFRFPLTGFSAYIEARYHSINNTGVSFVPLVFGLEF